MNIFRKDSARFDEANYENWKGKMKMHLLYMGLGYWLLTKDNKNIKEESKLEECSEAEGYMVMSNMRAKEALLSALPKNEYIQVNSLYTSHKIWKALESTFEGDTNEKRKRF